MAFEISVALIFKENGMDGTVLTVSESQTVGAVSVDLTLKTAEERHAAMLVALFERSREVLSILTESSRLKGLDQLDVHLEMLRDGTHPLLH